MLLVDRKTLHQPPELLPRDRPAFRVITGPLEPSVLKAFVQEDKSVAFPEKCLQTVALPSAEQEQRRLERIEHELLLDYCCKAVYGLAHIGISCRDIYILRDSDVT